MASSRALPTWPFEAELKGAIVTSKPGTTSILVGLQSSSLTLSLASPAFCFATSAPMLSWPATHCQAACSVSLSWASAVPDGLLVPYRK